MIDGESARWQFIYDTAKEYGFEGIHLTPNLYKQFNLDLENIPTYFQDFKLTFHFGGSRIVSAQDYELLDLNFNKAFKIASANQMHDLSLHPPYADGLSSEERKICLYRFDKLISTWIEKAYKLNITFCLETHVSPEFFLFRGMEEFIDFTDQHPDLGILIDISHNYYDFYSEDAIIDILSSRNVKALHISDALQGADFRKGTHLAIGDGTIDFQKLLACFSKTPNIFAALEIKAENKKLKKSLDQLKNMI